jgi:hypothetical protein
MEGHDWSCPWPTLKDLDALALAQVHRFWSGYGLEFPFRLEHKTTLGRGAYWSKGDYAFLRGDGTVSYAVRGKDKNARNAKHPTFTLLDHILEGDDEFPTELGFQHRGMVKIGKFKVIQNCRGYEALKGLRPGDDYTEERTARYNNNYFPLDDEQDYSRRRNRKKIHRGKTVQWFEKYGANGIAAVHRRMVQNDLAEGRK